MAKITFETFQELAPKVGQEVAVSDWLEVDQDRIGQFADATEDRQWIHIDVERAKRESPFKAPIAHGYLTLSLISGFLNESVEVKSVKRAINYGLNKMRFSTPVIAGSRLRGRFKLKECEKRASGPMQLIWEAIVDIEGQTKPACTAELVFLYYE